MPSTIGIRGVDKIYSGIDGRMQGFYTDGIIHRAIEPTHGQGAKTYDRYIESSASKRPLFHRSHPFCV
jgi:hypothetical protein